MTPRVARALWPNIGAEEGDARRLARLPAVATTRRLWAGLFDRNTSWLAPGLAEESADAMGLHVRCALDSLEASTGLVPWLADEAAHGAARSAGLAVFGAPADVVARLHDKAFAVSFARREGIGATALAEAIEIYDAPAAGDADAFARSVRARIEAWPDELRRGEFVLKPRFGTTGRGQLRAACASPNVDAIATHAARLAERGGAILEPWLDRSVDLSVVLHVQGLERAAGDRPAVQLIAALRQCISHAGAWRGHLGEIDRRGRIASGTAYDEPMREAAASIAHEARARSFLGPCGIDGFAYTPAGGGDATDALRPIVEFNARFTLGHVCAGWTRRALDWLVRARGLQSGRRAPFLFALAPPRDARDWRDAVASKSADVLPLPFATPLSADDPALELEAADGDAATGPALVFDEDREALEHLADRL